MNSNKIVFLFFVLTISFNNFAGAKMSEELIITSLKIKYSNQSLGPHNKIRTWSLNSSNEDFIKLAKQVVKEAKFQNKYSLEDYFKNENTIPPKKPRNQSSDQPTGQGYTEMTVHFNNGKSIHLDDYNDHFISAPFDKLLDLTRSKGSYTEHSADDPMVSIEPEFETPPKSKK